VKLLFESENPTPVLSGDKLNAIIDADGVFEVLFVFFEHEVKKTTLAKTTADNCRKERELNFTITTTFFKKNIDKQSVTEILP